ncbi:MAG TPA: hypothetical protein VFV94_03600 [Polyangiaceae bacterium]|nr:hypothetical protein [Polyangiaceae bacterium]
MSDPPREPRDEELEELGDEVILAQESAVHVPQPRQNVTTDHPTVVISEPVHAGGNRATVRRPRQSSEQTVVIRDRRQLDKMRKAISDRQQLKQPARVVETKTLYLLVAAALLSLVVGTLIAAFVDSRQYSPDLAGSGSAAASAPPPPAATTAAPLPTIDLDSLPVDRRKPHRKSQ